MGNLESNTGIATPGKVADTGLVTDLVGTWRGDDFEERLAESYATRSMLFPDPEAYSGSSDGTIDIMESDGGFGPED